MTPKTRFIPGVLLWPANYKADCPRETRIITGATNQRRAAEARERLQ